MTIQDEYDVYHKYALKYFSDIVKEKYGSQVDDEYIRHEAEKLLSRETLGGDDSHDESQHCQVK